MAIKVLLTGGGGFLGGNIIREADSGINIISVDSRKQEYEQFNLETVKQELTDSHGLIRILEENSPDVVIHTAAISDIDYCEAHKDIAEKVNIGVTDLITDYCRSKDIKMIHFSSDSVFDGLKGGYVEEDIPKPLHFYGKTKVEGEKLVSKKLNKWNIIRPSLIMGLPVEDSGNSFLWKMVKSLKDGKMVSFPVEEIRTPVDSVTLSRSVLELAKSDINGYFHLSGNTVLSRYEMALRICTFLNYDTKLVEPKKPVITTGRAPRPANVSLNNSKAKNTLSTPMKTLEEGLELVLSRRGEMNI